MYFIVCFPTICPVGRGSAGGPRGGPRDPQPRDPPGRASDFTFLNKPRWQKNKLKFLIFLLIRWSGLSGPPPGVAWGLVCAGHVVCLGEVPRSCARSAAARAAGGCVCRLMALCFARAAGGLQRGLVIEMSRLAGALERGFYRLPQAKTFLRRAKMFRLEVLNVSIPFIVALKRAVCCARSGAWRLR